MYLLPFLFENLQIPLSSSPEFTPSEALADGPIGVD